MIISFLLVPSAAFAWGPLTHIYLGNELYAFGSLLPAGIWEIIRRYKKDFIYGNVMADIIIGKTYLPSKKSSHNWAVAFDMLRSARTLQQKAFIYGYISHLAADTVAHNMYIADKKNIGHTVFEMKADSIIDKKYWLQAIAIEKKIQTRNDKLLEDSLDRFMFSFKTNKRIFKGMLFFSVFNQKRISNFIDDNFMTSLPPRETIEDCHRASINNMLDLLQNGERSEIVHINPSGTVLRRV
jgi:hypothetical protein